MDFWIKAAQLILSLSILIVLHEFGHFIPARLFKTKVEKFYLFFDPWFALFKKKIGDTEWGIGWIPLGGYVKISGMIDESMDKEQMAKPAEPWEFRSKPAWQRLIIMIGGVTVNLLLGIAIYIGVMFAYGEEKIHPNDLSNGMSVHPYMQKFGIKSGDNIVAIDGQKVSNVTDINTAVLLRGGRTLSVESPNGKSKTVHLPEGVEYELFKQGAFPIVSLRSSTLSVDSVIAGKPAAKSGLQKGDKMVAIQGEKLVYYDDIQRVLFNNKGKSVKIALLRGNDRMDIKANVQKDGTLGFVLAEPIYKDEKKIKHITYGFGESIGRGIDKGFHTLSDYVAQIKFIFTEKGATSLGGFGTMGKLFPSTWDWQIFWMNTALISIILAFMNILPIPALDGGHVVFLLYEMITGKEAPQKVLEYAQYVGFFLLMGLVLYANGNDIYRWLFGG
jgi:regulator of sigma E protease